MGFGEIDRKAVELQSAKRGAGVRGPFVVIFGFVLLALCVAGAVVITRAGGRMARVPTTRSAVAVPAAIRAEAPVSPPIAAPSTSAAAAEVTMARRAFVRVDAVMHAVRIGYPASGTSSDWTWVTFEAPAALTPALKELELLGRATPLAAVHEEVARYTGAVRIALGQFARVHKRPTVDREAMNAWDAFAAASQALRAGLVALPADAASPDHAFATATMVCARGLDVIAAAPSFEPNPSPRVEADPDRVVPAWRAPVEPARFTAAATACLRAVATAMDQPAGMAGLTSSIAMYLTSAALALANEGEGVRAGYATPWASNFAQNLAYATSHLDPAR